MMPSPRVPPDARRIADPDPSAAHLQRAVGREYEVAECLGQGGFGVVYAARDVRLGRPVAIKALRSDLFESDAMRQRFESEARVVASLRHPHIVPIFQVGEGDGLAYMIMPRIDGVTLRSELERRGRLPVSEVLRIGRISCWRVPTGGRS
jgi:serine/threonine protein kinase